MSKHSLRRTSPKGGPFVGICQRCGMPDLPIEAVKWECQNPANLTDGEALTLAITGRVQ